MVAGGIQPAVPNFFAELEHFKWIFEIMIAQINEVDLRAIRFGQCGQRFCDAVHIIEMFVNGIADNNIHGRALLGRH